jgi:hypothetical protein
MSETEFKAFDPNGPELNNRPEDGVDQAQPEQEPQATNEVAELGSAAVGSVAEAPEPKSEPDVEQPTKVGYEQGVIGPISETKPKPPRVVNQVGGLVGGTPNPYSTTERPSATTGFIGEKPTEPQNASQPRGQNLTGMIH